MDDNVIETNINQAVEDLHGAKFSNIDTKTTINDYKERGNDSNSDFKDDDISFKGESE